MLTFKDFKNLPTEYQDAYIKEVLPIINFCNSHMISTKECMILAEKFCPIIEERCFLGNRLSRYLDQLLRREKLWRFGLLNNLDK